MKNSDLYAQLELITTEFDYPASTHFSRASQVWAKSKARLSRMGQSLLQTLYSSSEPHISVRRDRIGNTFFIAYDPFTQANYTFTTERELRVWLDQRYYQ